MIIRILQLDAKVSSNLIKYTVQYNIILYSNRETSTTIESYTRYRNSHVYGQYIYIALGRGFSGNTHRVHETRHSFVSGRIVKGFAAHDVYTYTYVCAVGGLYAPLYFRGKVDVRHVRFTTLWPYRMYTSARYKYYILKTLNRSPGRI